MNFRALVVVQRKLGGNEASQLHIGSLVASGAHDGKTYGGGKVDEFHLGFLLFMRSVTSVNYIFKVRVCRAAYTRDVVWNTHCATRSDVIIFLMYRFHTFYKAQTLDQPNRALEKVAILLGEEFREHQTHPYIEL